MALTCPTHAIPGELLVSTELVEDADYHKAWRVPAALYDASDNLVQMKHGDLWLVIASWLRPKVRAHAPMDEVWMTLALHLRTTKLFELYDVEHKGWLWWPDPAMDELRKEIKERACNP